MTVLIIMGVLLVLFAIAMLVIGLNDYSDKHFRYVLFSYEQLAWVGVPSVVGYFSHSSYVSAVAHNGDIYNGLILMTFSALVLLFVIYRNIKSTNLRFGLLGSIIQFAILMPLSFLALIGILLAIAALAQTKPVYNLNSCDRD